MDILDPLDSSGEAEIVDSKVLLNDSISIHCKTVVESDDEITEVEHFSPQSLLDTSGVDEGEHQYALRSSEGMITYRVLQVDDNGVEAVPEFVSSGTSYATAPQVVNNLNGQVFVIGNPNELFANNTTSGAAARHIAPRNAMQVPPSTTPNSFMKEIKKVKRDERRRATHNEVERRRRDKINNWITRLSKIIPETTSSELKGNGSFEGQSKGGILAKACEYITELSESKKKLENTTLDNKVLRDAMESLTRKNATLQEENDRLHEILKRHGIDTKEFLCLGCKKAL